MSSAKNSCLNAESTLAALNAGYDTLIRYMIVALSRGLGIFGSWVFAAVGNLYPASRGPPV
jgi:hypothetical protein